jgi:DNA-binding MarR family transcriptional regulator
MTKKAATPARRAAGSDKAPRGELPPYTASPRQGLDDLQRAVYLCAAVQRRLAWHHTHTGEALSQDRMRVLAVIMADGEATHGMLAREAGINPAIVTSMIEQLEAQGLVQRRRDDEDRRIVWISLTAKGSRQLRKRQAEWNGIFAEAFADTTDKELAIASRVLDRLTGLFESLID